MGARALMFDFNGTLSDDEPLLFAILERPLRRAGEAALRERLLRTTGGPLGPGDRAHLARRRPSRRRVGARGAGRALPGAGRRRLHDLARRPCCFPPRGRSRAGRRRVGRPPGRGRAGARGGRARDRGAGRGHDRGRRRGKARSGRLPARARPARRRPRPGGGHGLRRHGGRASPPRRQRGCTAWRSPERMRRSGSPWRTSSLRR